MNGNGAKNARPEFPMIEPTLAPMAWVMLPVSANDGKRYIHIHIAHPLGAFSNIVEIDDAKKMRATLDKAIQEASTDIVIASEIPHVVPPFNPNNGR